MKKLLVVLCVTTVFSAAWAGVIHVPADESTVQRGIDVAVNGDTVLIAPGMYHENLSLKGKTIILASRFIEHQDRTFIRETILDGGGKTVLDISDVGPETAVTGLTIQNGDDGIFVTSKFNLLHNIIRDCEDGIDYEKFSGGICRFNIFEENRDDGIDLDDMPDIVIEDNIIRNNQDDGIEIRLHEYSGPVITYIIRRNLISGHGEDGIQIIDYPDVSDRVLYIERNVIEKTDMAAIGFMPDGNTRESYEAAPVPEPVFIVNNTIAWSNYGITGGNQVLVMNNIIVNTSKTALKGIRGRSLVMGNCLWQNGTDIENVNQGEAGQLYKKPEFTGFYQLRPESPCIDVGISVSGESMEYTVATEFVQGKGIDLGAFEKGGKDWPAGRLLP